MRLIKAVCSAAVLMACFAPGVLADAWNKKTILTFSGPVQIPGATLPAGTYVFKLADLQGNRHVVQIFDKAEKKIYRTILAIPDQRLTPSDKPVILFSERPAGSPQAVRAWFYPGETIGNEFVYPKSQAMQIAKQTHQSVLAMDDQPKSDATDADMNSMKSAAVTRVDENGESTAVSTEQRAEAQPPAAGNAAVATSGQASGTMAKNDAKPNSRKRLPQTASNLTMFEMISGLMLIGGLCVRRVRTHDAGL
jgi:hypothetical protein